tara:strand:- start:16507 stop:17325 length:819 start_codon:yes stop_codon:yes gene_type:complete
MYKLSRKIQRKRATMTKTISFVNQKGGVGKTTSVINIAACLAEQNASVLIIDMDPQGNTTQVYSNITDDDDSVYNLLVNNTNNTSINSLKKSTYINNVDLLPSNVLLSSAELDLVNKENRESILKNVLKNNQKDCSKYDYILVDCQPSLGLLTINSIMASDYIMVPLHADIFSLTGLDLLTQTLSKLQTIFESNTTILGFFFTQVNKKETLFNEAYELCLETYPKELFKSCITTSTSIDQANATGQSVIHLSPQANPSNDYRELTIELMKKA